MFKDNLKRIRKEKGFTQEELAIRLNVVRQTVSKWENGLSVPDADLLIRISEVLEVSVSELLGAKIEQEQDTNVLADQLARINEQLAVRNRRITNIWKVVLGVFAAIIIISLILMALGLVQFMMSAL